jgi:hypothetical protein
VNKLSNISVYSVDDEVWMIGSYGVVQLKKFGHPSNETLPCVRVKIRFFGHDCNFE